MVALIPTILGVIVVLLAFYAVITRKNWLEAKALLADTTIRYETALQQTQKSEQGSKAQKDLIEKLRVQAQKAERSADDVKNRSSDGKLEIIRMKTEHDESFKKLESNREHLLEQVTVLTQQLSEAVREKKIYSEELSTLTRETEKMGQAMSESLRNQLGEVKNELSLARRERSNALSALEKFKTESGLVKPEELKRWQAKVARLEQLYASMKGLREMAEERNENWETALRFFAIHILGQPQTASGDASIGALVGEALEKIGATLVDDDAEAAPYTLADKASPSQAEQLS
ncbi:MAG: hypothetical protein EOP07_11885 [Proteobacteria bacterium]|nr:MAG: hypothetical protein EOP07_11885 [Pseudomonadota bacterium]